MEIVKVKISELKHPDYNPRHLSKKEAADLKKSIEKFGLVDPIIVNQHPERKNIIVGGNQRVRIAKEMGLTEVDAVFVNLDPEKEKELCLRLNKNHAEWDWDKLANEFDEIMLNEVGFDDIEINKALDGITEVTEDEAPEPPKEPTSKLGEVYELGRHRLMCGDSTKKEDVEKLMNGKKADMVFTDPPYNVDYGSSKNPRHKIRKIENDSMSQEDWADFCGDFITNVLEYNSGDVYIWGASGPDGMKMRLQLVDMGFHWSATIVWKKQQLVLSPANYQRMYEPCFYGWKDQSSYCGDRKQVEVWEIDRPLNSKLHPTMKPIELCAKAINNSSKRDNIVLDLFGGSGSTLIAAEQTGRTCYMQELEPKYIDVIIQRWMKLTNKKAKKIIDAGGKPVEEYVKFADEGSLQ